MLSTTQTLQQANICNIGFHNHPPLQYRNIAPSQQVDRQMPSAKYHSPNTPAKYHLSHVICHMSQKTGLKPPKHQSALVNSQHNQSASVSIYRISQQYWGLISKISQHQSALDQSAQVLGYKGSVSIRHPVKWGTKYQSAPEKGCFVLVMHSEKGN